MRPVIPALLALLLVGGVGACGPSEQPEQGQPTTSTTTEEETTMDQVNAREAARAEQPVVEKRLREVAALVHPDLEAYELEDPRWLGGGTAACTWDRSSLSYIADGAVAVEDPQETARSLVEQLPEGWEPRESRSAPDDAWYFGDADGYLLLITSQTDPDFLLLRLESPCHG